jgi:hypothetical protein
MFGKEDIGAWILITKPDDPWWANMLVWLINHVRNRTLNHGMYALYNWLMARFGPANSGYYRISDVVPTEGVVFSDGSRLL